MTVEDQMDAEDYESTLELLSDLGGLLRAEGWAPEDQIRAAVHAITLAIGGNPEQARDFIRDFLLDRLRP